MKISRKNAPAENRTQVSRILLFNKKTATVRTLWLPKPAKSQAFLQYPLYYRGIKKKE